MSKFSNDLSADELRDLLDYDPDTGVFRWRPRSSNPSFTSSFGGKEAGTIMRNGYVAISIFDRNYLGHRLAWLHVTGDWPERIIDHKDGDPANNKWENLRQASSSQNGANSKLFRNNQTGVKGVGWVTNARKWQAQLQYDGIRYSKMFTSFDDACEWRRHMASELQGEFEKSLHSPRQEFVDIHDSTRRKRKYARSNANTSGVKGVSWHKGKRKWAAYLQYNGVRYKFGAFLNFDDAVSEYRARAREIMGDDYHEDVA